MATTNAPVWLDRINDVRSATADALVDAFSVGAVRRGMLGTLLIALGSLTPAFLPENSPWWKILGYFRDFYWILPTLGTLSALAGILLVMESWFRLRPRPGGPKVDARAVLFLWSFPMLMAPPILSHDSYAYAAEGYMIHIGMNPYDIGAGMMQNRWGEQVVEDWRFTRAPYGPLSLQLSHLVVGLFAQSPYWSSALGMRLLAIAGLTLVALTIPDLAKRLRVNAQRAMWFGLLNPLTIAHLVGGEHNDAWMIGLVAVGCWAAARKRFLLGCVFIAAAAAIKIPAIIAIVPVALLGLPIKSPLKGSWGRLWQAGWRVFVGTLVMTAVFLLISLACGLGMTGWITAINVPGMVVTISPPTMLGEILRTLLNAMGQYRAAAGVVRLTRQIAMGLAVVLILWFLVKHAPKHPMKFMVFSWLTLMLCSPALHPWYFTWPAVFFVFAHPSVRFTRIACWASVGLLTYSAVSFSWRNDVLAIGIGTILMVIWILRGHDREQFQKMVDSDDPDYDIATITAEEQAAVAEETAR